MYLAVVLDAFSRRVIGWALGRTLEAELAVAALAHGAASSGSRRPDWCITPIAACSMLRTTTPEMLKQHQATISMSRKGNPYDNAACESFMKTLKYEEVYRNEYRDFHDARARSASFWNVSIIRNDCTRLSAMCRPPSSKTAPCNELRIAIARLNTGALPLRPRDLTHLRQNGCVAGRLIARPRSFRPLSRRSGRIPAVALSSAQVLPEWITSTSPCNAFAANGDNPLNFVSHSRGSLHKRSAEGRGHPFPARGAKLLSRCKPG